MKRALLIALALIALVACSPKLDWREVRPAGSGLLLMFPCKPSVESRAAAPAGPQGAMGLAVCETDGLSFSVVWAEVAEPALVGPALKQMRESLLARLKVQAGAAQALTVPGMTPQDEALQLSFEAGADGAVRQGRVAVFARGLRVYQLVMHGGRGGSQAEQAWETFVGALRLES